MYAFQVDLIAAQTRPFPQVYLKYPEQIECFNLRKYNRAECHLYAVVEVGGDGLQALIGDISVGGCRIAINLGKLDLGYTPVFTVGDLVDLNFTLDDLEHRVVLCEVKNVRSDSSVIHLGLAFMEAEDDLKEAIQNFVDNLMMFQE
jgi:c-di-GMP-binding flagellar brake protein YcgR